MSMVRGAILERLPTSDAGLVGRRRLLQRLSAAPPSGVVLVCALAGSGKSLLVRSWAESEGLGDRVAWVQVERGEQDEQRFWLSVIDALSRVVGFIERAPAPGFRGELVIERLLSELDAVDEPLLLAIDDLHELRSAEGLRWLELFVAQLPSALRLVLITREDPRLGLHRLRLAGELTELRGPDLAFSLKETRELLEASGISLSDDGVALLHERTEGWAAGLRLAVISLVRHPDPERFVREFSGSERTVAGYLLAEVLERQPAEVRDLLLRTSVLERVSGPLADFVTGSVGCERVLQELEDANAFVSSLDVGRSWFRYHQLFADLLQLELRRSSPAVVGSLHAAAARWYEQHRFTVESIRHAQAARDWPYASHLLADHSFDLIFCGRISTVRELLLAFPPDVAAGDPELALVSSAMHLLGGRREESAAYVDLAQQLAGPQTRSGRICATSTPSWAPTVAPTPSPAPAGLDCSRHHRGLDKGLSGARDFPRMFASRAARSSATSHCSLRQTWSGTLVTRTFGSAASESRSLVAVSSYRSRCHQWRSASSGTITVSVSSGRWACSASM